MSETLNLKTISTIDPSPFKHLCVTIGELPSAFVESMSYYELLAWFVNYLENTVIPAVNANGEATAELQELFIELKDFVDHYFENLDVQEEINNKLDEMAEDGTLQEIITTYIQSNVAWTFDTVADMKLATNLIDGSYARTLGFHSVNDGGGGLYKITDTGTANEMNIIAVDTLYATLVPGNEINVKQVGAYGDNTHDDTNAIALALTLNLPVYLPKGEYKITSSISIGNRIVRGDGQFNTFIKPTNDVASYAIAISSDHTKICDLSIVSPDYDYDVKGTTNEKYGIDIESHHHLTLKNVRIVGFNHGLHAVNAWCISSYDSMFLCCNYGVYGTQNFNNVLFERNLFHTCDDGFYCASGSGIKIDTCDIENNNKGVEVTNNSSFITDTCYFESNSNCSVRIAYGTTWVREAIIQNCTFYESTTQGAIKYHSDASANIIIENCEFRNNSTLSAGANPIIVKESSSLNIPYLIGCYIGASWRVGDKCYVNKLHPVELSASDIFTASENYSFEDFNVWIENNHIFGTGTVYNANGIPNTNTVVATFKADYKPTKAIITFGSLSSAHYGQDTNDLCYVYLNSATGMTVKGNGTATRARFSLDYIV